MEQGKSLLGATSPSPRSWRRIRVRFTIRALLVVVAAAALGLGTYVILIQRADRFRRLAALHLQAADILTDQLGTGPEHIDPQEGETIDQAIERFFALQGPEQHQTFRAALYHDRLFDKYREAAMRPWQRVEADPPRPAKAFPQFSEDPNYARMVREWDDPPHSFK